MPSLFNKPKDLLAAAGDKGEIVEGEAAIFQKACELSDLGFGEFDVCLTVLTAKKGNVTLAKDALSKVIFS